MNLAAKAAKNLRNELPYFASADDADRFAMQIKTNESAEREVQLPDPVEGSMNFSVEREQEGQGVFGHRVRKICRNADHVDSQRVRSGHVHVVKPRTAQRDELYA